MLPQNGDAATTPGPTFDFNSLLNLLINDPVQSSSEADSGDGAQNLDQPGSGSSEQSRKRDDRPAQQLPNVASLSQIFYQAGFAQVPCPQRPDLPSQSASGQGPAPQLGPSIGDTTGNGPSLASAASVQQESGSSATGTGSYSLTPAALTSRASIQDLSGLQGSRGVVAPVPSADPSLAMGTQTGAQVIAQPNQAPIQNVPAPSYRVRLSGGMELQSRRRVPATADESPQIVGSNVISAPVPFSPPVAKSSPGPYLNARSQAPGVDSRGSSSIEVLLNRDNIAAVSTSPIPPKGSLGDLAIAAQFAEKPPTPSQTLSEPRVGGAAPPPAPLNMLPPSSPASPEVPDTRPVQANASEKTAIPEQPITASSSSDMDMGSGNGQSGESQKVEAAVKNKPESGNQAAPAENALPAGTQAAVPGSSLAIGVGAPGHRAVPSSNPNLGEIVESKSETNGSLSPPPAREISLRLPGSESGSVDLRVMERGGRLHVSVRTQDPDLVRVLQSDVGDLVGRLEKKGFETENLWMPSARTGQHVSEVESSRSNSDQAFGRQPDSNSSSGGDREPGERQSRPRWVEEMDSEFSVNHEGETTE